jgi:hypothetical protein
MFIEAEEFLYIVDLKYSQDLGLESGISEYSWEEFKESLLTHRISNKKDGRGFMPVMTKPESEWKTLTTKSGIEHYRGDVNIEAITCLVIDLDKPGALEEGQALFDGYEYVVYSTHNFTPDTPWKYRMAIRLLEPILVESWPVCFEALKSRIALDTTCCNPSRFYYYPSHSPDSNISPRAFHRPGKPLSMDDILALSADKDSLSQHSPARYKQLASSNTVRTRRHFSGVKVGHFDSVAEVDVSFEAMSQRHAKSLGEYDIEGSRHNLALSVSSRELYKYGPKTDLKSLILFIFKVAAVGHRPLETGNTADELPAMLITGMIKYAPEAYDKLMEEHDGNVEPFLSSLVRWASLNYKDAPLVAPPIKNKDEASEEGDYYPILRARHRSFLADYVKTGDLKSLLKQVMALELKSDRPRYADLAKALVNYQYGYFTKVAKRSPESAWLAIKNELPLAARLFSEKHIPADAKKITFAKGALLVEISQRIPPEILQTKEQAGLTLN